MQPPQKFLKLILVNYSFRIIIMMFSFVITPFYLVIMGPEQYGIIGLYLLMIPLFVSFNFGTSITASRQISGNRGMEGQQVLLAQQVKSLQSLMLLCCLACIIVLFLVKDWILNTWLVYSGELAETLVRASGWIVLAVALQLIMQFYTICINAYEDVIWLNKRLAVITVLQNSLQLLAVYLTQDLVTYFYVSIVFTGFFVLLLYLRLHRVHLRKLLEQSSFFYIDSIRPYFGFIPYIGYTGILIIAARELHRPIFFNALEPKILGFLALCFSAVGIVKTINNIFLNTLQPRLFYLLKHEGENRFRQFYHLAGQFQSVILLGLGVPLSAYSGHLLWLWTRNEELAIWGAQPLRWITFSAIVAVFACFPKNLQLARGSGKMDLGYQHLRIIIFAPLIYTMVHKYGMTGAMYTLAGFNLTMVLLWAPIVHKLLLPGHYVNWLLKRIAPMVIVSYCFFQIMDRSVFWFSSKPILLIFVMLGLGALHLFCIAMTSRELRKVAASIILRLRFKEGQRTS